MRAGLEVKLAVCVWGGVKGESSATRAYVHYCIGHRGASPRNARLC